MARESDLDIVITGAGVVAPVGIGLVAATDGLASSRDALVPMDGTIPPDSTLARTPAPEWSFSRPATAFAVADFDPHALLPGVKGLKSMSRTAQLACAAAALALADATLPSGDDAGDEIGIVGGTVYGNVGSVARFVHEVETEGPRFVDAMLFPNTVLNSPAGFASIAFNLTGLNSTVNAGPATGLAALAYAVRLLKRGRAKVILAGAYEELSPWLYLGFEAEGRLAPAAGRGGGRPLPYGRDRQGTQLGEGAALLCLETRAGARARGASPHTQIAGLAEAYAAGGDLARSYAAVIRRVLLSAEVEPAELGAAFVAASGEKEFDRLEARALREALGPAAFERVPLVPLKAWIGETSGAHGALAAAAAHGALVRDLLPQLPEYPLDPEIGRDHLAGAVVPGALAGKPVLVACAGQSRSLAAIVLRPG
jgi:3-oxoacyl-[acyl-carrier-protein] synthase II